MNEQLVFELSVDTVDLVKGLATAKNGLDQFAEVGKTSIAQLNAALKALEAQAGKSVNPSEIEKLKGSYAEVKAEVTRFRKEFRELKNQSDETGNSLDQTGQKAKKSADGLTQAEKEARRTRIAAYGLNQVIRDLPFGFIAISNNLPVLFDQFAELRRETGSNKAAFSALAGSILGAGGASIAFSVITSLITTAVQKYGSLKGAVDALVLSNTDLLESYNKAKKSLEEFNKALLANSDIQRRAASSADVEAIQVRALVGVVKSATSTDKQRANAISGLQKISKEYFGVLEGGKFTTEQLTQAVSNYQKSLTAQNEIKGFQKTIDETNAKISEQRTLLDQNRAEQQRNTAEIDKNTNAVLRGGNQAEIAAGKVKSLVSERFVLRKIEAELTAEIDKLNVTLGNYEKGLVDATVTSTNYGESVQTAADASKAQKDAIDREIAKLIDKKQEYKESAKGLSQLGQEYLNVEIAIAKIDAAISKLKTDSISEKLEIDIKLGETIKKLIDDANARIKESRGIDFTPLFQTTGDEFKKRSNQLFDPAQVNRFSEALKTAGQIFGNIKIIPSESVTKSIAEVQKIREEAFLTAKAFMEVLGPAIDTVFNAIENGENIFQAIGKSLKQLVLDLVKATVKAAAFALIITALTAGTGAPVPFGAAFKTGLQLQSGGIGGLGALFGGGGVAAQGGGLSVGPGGLAIQGNVTFVQRGQDLVGVLSQSNARINRVG
jgi:chromosome segregation ATPase